MGTPEYHAKYYRKNKAKWDARRREKRDEINARKREQYKNDPAVREYYINAAKRYKNNNIKKVRYASIKKLYGLSADTYEKILENQQGCCAICLLKMTKTPHVDHCHKSKKVRGLLCFNCNRAIGHMQDDPAIAKRAASYLERDGDASGQ